jgi:hypothetical protein
MISSHILALLALSNAATTTTTVGTFPPSHPPPTLERISPDSGPEHGGTTVTITGDHFERAPNVPSVTLVGEVCEVVEFNDTSIQCRSKPHAGGGHGKVVVETRHGQSDTLTFTYNYGKHHLI